MTHPSVLEKQTTEPEQNTDIGLLDTRETDFYKTDGGFTGLRYKGKTIPRVSFRRALPIGKPDSYISVADDENKEIGIIRDIGDLSHTQRDVVREDLAKRYFCPSVQSVKSVKDKMGYVYMELILTGAGTTYEKSCAINDVNRNIRMIDGSRLLIFDVDGNRYIIENIQALDKKSMSRLEPYMF